jgi:hypothetical protein
MPRSIGETAGVCGLGRLALPAFAGDLATSRVGAAFSG